MKLYNCPSKSKIRLIEDIQTPPGGYPLKKGDELFFDHLDGIYSYCTKEIAGRQLQIVHLVGWTEVELIKD